MSPKYIQPLTLSRAWALVSPRVKAGGLAQSKVFPKHFPKLSQNGKSRI